ncbi:MAG TPA: hypothetical protein VK619_06445 [Pyrinomonadaceae bacterium]|nr:hypothetical protein [Pyrinomonadaceae bacterium]
MSSNPLIAEMQGERRKWARSTVVYGTLNVAARIFLILASSIVSAEKNLIDSSAGFLVKWVPVLALAVTTVTAIDTWLKPRDKWRGFMEDRDALSDLLIRAQKPQIDDATNFDKLTGDFSKLRRRHRNKNVY